MSILKKIWQAIVQILLIPQQIVRYIARAAARIFGPTDDQYPPTGVQPFEGEPDDRKKKRHGGAW